MAVFFQNTDKMTCFTHNGESVVDYLITSENKFSSLSYMIVHDYKEFSNHAPLAFGIKIGTERSREATTKSASNLRWNDEYTNDFVNRLQTDCTMLSKMIFLWTEWLINLLLS